MIAHHEQLLLQSESKKGENPRRRKVATYIQK